MILLHNFNQVDTHLILLNNFDQVDTHLILLNNFDQVDTHSCLQALSDKLQPQISPFQSSKDDLNGLQVSRLNKKQTLALSLYFTQYWLCVQSGFPSPFL